MPSNDEIHDVTLYLNKSQFLKYKKGKAFQLSFDQLRLRTGKHEVTVKLDTKEYKRLLVAVKKSLGFRFSEGKVLGGSLYGVLKEKANRVKDFVANSVKKEAIKTVLDSGVDIVTPVKVVGKKTNNTIKNIVNNTVDGVMGSGCDDCEVSGGSFKALGRTGGAVKKVRFSKGSIEAKEYMAKLRNLRKRKGSELTKQELDNKLPVEMPAGFTIDHKLHSPASNMVNGIPTGMGNIDGVEKPSMKKRGRKINNGIIKGGSMLTL